MQKGKYKTFVGLWHYYLFAHLQMYARPPALIISDIYLRLGSESICNT